MAAQPLVENRDRDEFGARLSLWKKVNNTADHFVGYAAPIVHISSVRDCYYRIPTVRYDPNNGGTPHKRSVVGTVNPPLMVESGRAAPSRLYSYPATICIVLCRRWFVKFSKTCRGKDNRISPLKSVEVRFGKLQVIFHRAMYRIGGTHCA
jgi:hypothetical protein